MQLKICLPGQFQHALCGGGRWDCSNMAASCGGVLKIERWEGCRAVSQASNLKYVVARHVRSPET